MHAMQCVKADKFCIGWLIPVFPLEPTTVQACRHTADAWGVHLILDDASLYCVGVLTEVLHG